MFKRYPHIAEIKYYEMMPDGKKVCIGECVCSVRKIDLAQETMPIYTMESLEPEIVKHGPQRLCLEGDIMSYSHKEIEEAVALPGDPANNNRIRNIEIT